MLGRTLLRSVLAVQDRQLGEDTHLFQGMSIAILEHLEANLHELAQG